MNKIIQGDALEVLKTLPSESVDCIITDPPYNISQDGAKISRHNLKFGVYRQDTSIKLDFGDWDKMEEKEFFDFTESWFIECSRILKGGRWICIFFDKQKTGFFDLLLAKKYGIKPKTILVWLKSNPTPQFRKANFTSASEFIWCGVKGEGKIIIISGRVDDLTNSTTYKSFTTVKGFQPKVFFELPDLQASNQTKLLRIANLQNTKQKQDKPPLKGGII